MEVIPKGTTFEYRITLNTKTMETQFNVNGTNIEMSIDGIYAGYIQVYGEGSGVYRIEKSEIEIQFRGFGLYRKLIASVFELKNCEIIKSDNRNESSNSIYQNWTGENIDGNQLVWIQKIGGNLEFTIDEE